jgi:hydrogenase expression/formation protein HypD
MKFVDEYRDPAVAQKLIAKIHELADEPISIMEICGGHTHAIFRAGIDQVLPPQIRFIHGPGCPVCVTPMEKLDQIMKLARRPNTIIATYGDMMRVPGSESTLLKERAKGAQVKMVYSSLDAVRLAQENPDKEVVFFAVGFETTIPANGFSVLKAKELGLKNYSMLSNHVLVPPIIRYLLNDKVVHLDALIGPGHVGTIVGSADYEFIPKEYNRPVVISGFEPNDLLQSVYMILKQRQENRCEVEVQYSRAVKYEGNPKAKQVVEKLFEVVDQEWRGIGMIPQSGLALRPEFREYDAAYKFQDWLGETKSAESAQCICGEIVKGVKEPWDCPSFGTECTPDNPLGTCMVSTEGTCAAYYRYQYVKRMAGGVGR